MAEYPLLLLIFGGGVATLLSPCGYALIPAYITYNIGDGNRVKQALIRSFITSVGVILIYTMLALMISFLREAVREFIPHLSLLSALVVISLGFIKLFEISLPTISLISRSVGLGGRTGSILPFFIFGLGYGLGASGCNLPIFLVVLFYAFLGSFGNPVMILLTYALGVIAPLIAVGVIASITGFSMMRKLSPYTYYIHKIAGIVMVIAGVYLIYYYFTIYNEFIISPYGWNNSTGMG